MVCITGCQILCLFVAYYLDIPEETGTVVAEKRNYETALGK